MKALKQLLLVLTLLGIITNQVYSQVEIILRKSFIDSVKNQVTYTAQMNIVKAHKKANPASKDGDMHVAGTIGSIGLPVVMEIMNAKNEKRAVDIVHSNEGTSNLVSVKGAWRIWCEHAGSEYKQDQGEGFPEIVNSNPDHVFEIHPATQIEDVKLIGSLKPIIGYEYKEAQDAFSRYSNTRCKLKDLDNKIEIETNGVGYNYVEFWIEVAEDNQFVADDGRFVFCKVLDKDGELICNKVRMAFPKDSKAEKAVKKLKKGGTMHVLGIPRIDLALVAYRVENVNKNPEMLEWNLPVEMIIVAKF